MRKAVFIFGVIALMSTSCALFNQNKEEKFVNPLFYKKLSPISRGARPTFLTPTSQTYFDLYNNKVVRQCKMLENTQMFITLECFL